ncbi:MAG: FecR domain-containing protein [Saprospiraceae bacterium]|nr:FecR domain-containing protein [Saprospiraceae bacterium]
MTLPDNITLLLTRQWNGASLTDAEQSALDQWLAAPDHAAEADRLHRVWSAAGNYPSHYEPDFEAGWNKLKANMAQDVPVRKLPAKMFPLRRVLALAASVLLLIVAGYLWLLPDAPADQPYRTVAALSGKPMEVALPDGSLVLLQNGAELSFPETFPDKGVREVELSGEAYFKVARDEKRPFQVLSGYALTEVLGTTFNVRARPEDSLVEVTVETGRVRLSSVAQPGSGLVLKPGERGQCPPDGELTKTGDREINALSWMTGQLRFRKTPLSQALQAIERHYEVTLELEKSVLNACSYTGSFEKANLKDVLLTLELTYGVHISQASPQRYVLRGGSCQ